MNKIHSRTTNLLYAFADTLGKLWALPYTVLGLGYGLLLHWPSRLSGVRSQIRFGHNAVQFIGCRGIVECAALTLGNVVLYGRGAEPESGGAYGDESANLGKHEEAHTFQYQLLGPLFVLVYCLSGGNKPDRNPLEQAAQLFATGRGSWWPSAYTKKWRALNSAG